MRILHLSALYPPLVVGGAERSVAMLAEAQVRAGHEVSVACTTPDSFCEEQRAGVHVFRMPHETAFWSEDWPSHSPLRRLQRKAAMPFNARQRRHFERVLDIVRPDIVHSHSMNNVTTACWSAAKRRGYVLVHTLRDYDLMCVNCSLYHNGRPCGLRCRVLSLPKQRQHHAIMGVASNSAETLRLHIDAGLFAHVPDPLRRVIWSISGLPTDQTDARAIRSGPMTFGYFGRINEEKGVGTLLDAARLLKGAKDFRILVGGELTSLAERFQAQAEGLPVEFVGFVGGADFFPRVDVLVIPSIWPEPLPRTALEAYAAGVPVLSSRAGGTPDLIGHDNVDWLFPPGDAARLAAAMVRIMREGRDALPPPESFTPILEQTTEAVVLARYQAFYHDVLAAQGRLPAGQLIGS